MNATGGWPSGSTVCFTPMINPEVLNAKQGNSMHHFQVFGMNRPGTEKIEHSNTGPRMRIIIALESFLKEVERNIWNISRNGKV